MSLTIGAITIGQSPREDIIPDLKMLIGAEVSIEVRGILDRMEREEIRNFAPRRKEKILNTRLRNGESVTLGYNHVVEGIRKTLAELRNDGYASIALLCTCHFSELNDEKGLIQVSTLLRQEVEAKLKKGILGILVPSAEQIGQTEKEWFCPGLKVIVASASPYGKSTDVISAVSHLSTKAVDLILLDCIGYNLSLFNELKEITETPMILSVEVLAHHLRKHLFSEK